MINILDFTIEDLQNELKKIKQPRFRGQQIFQWIYKGVKNFNEMENLPLDLRRKLSCKYKIELPSIEKRQVSEKDGTEKFLLKLEDGNHIETVFMKYEYGNSICVSSQVGCRMGCLFCASQVNGFVRNLKTGEIVGQVLQVKEKIKEPINHIVVMGIGEPFDNYDNLKKFLEIVTCKDGINLSRRNITVSTCGLIPKMEEFATDFPQVGLAVSLHSSRDEIRNKIMPINQKFSVDEIIEASKKYVERTHRRITFEYILIDGLNDSADDAELLARKVKGLNCHVNLIPNNDVTESGLKGSDKRQVKAFEKHLLSKGIQVSIRRQLGEDIDGACGQLRLKM